MGSMSKMPQAAPPESNSRSPFDSPTVFQPCGRCLLSYACEIGALNFEFERLAYCKKTWIESSSATNLRCWISGGAGAQKKTTELSMYMRFIWKNGVIGVEESTHQGKHCSLRQIGDRVQVFVNFSLTLEAHFMSIALASILGNEISIKFPQLFFFISVSNTSGDLSEECGDRIGIAENIMKTKNRTSSC